MKYQLREDSWYAAEFIGDDPLRPQVLPHHVGRITPLKTGKRIFELKFFHANYPQGVQDNTYRLQTIHAGGEYIMARSVDHASSRFLLINDIDSEWLKQHYQINLAGIERAENWLNSVFNVGKV